jgi:phenylalanyl-tRNA synthetase beta chain
VLNACTVSYPSVQPVGPVTDDIFPVSLSAPEACPRYLGRVVRDVDLSRGSPLWLRERLRRCGLRSIDPVVDVTNYVMLELGQPMHAFDLDQLSDEIAVRMARPGETLTLLDGRDVSLDGETLLITDGKGPVAIAGVMGGERSGMGAETRDVFLECAFFSPLAIAGTARRYGLHTDASHRYERGVDFELQHVAMERATALLLEIVGGRPGPVTESVNADHLPVRQTVRLRERRLTQLAGVSIAAGDVDAVFERLDFPLVDRVDDATEGVCWTIEAPSHRFDIEREADLVEEVVRIYGYNQVPPRRPVTDLGLRQVPLLQSSEAALKRFLASQGLQEAVTYSFVDPKLEDLCGSLLTPLALANPMSSEQAVMRTTMMPGLVGALRVNLSRQQERVRLFEVGQCFQPGESGGGTGPGRIRQQTMVAGILSGPRYPESWNQGRDEVDFFDLKGLVEQLIDWAGLEGVRFEASEDRVLHPGQAAAVLFDGEQAGRLGRLHPEIEERLEIARPVYFFELAAEAVLQRGARRFQGFSRYPSVRRDLALVVNREVAAAEV